MCILCRVPDVTAAAAIAGIALGASFSAAAIVAAQTPSLAEVARKEQERRKALPSATKVYTNKDLPKTAVRPEGALPPPTAPSAETPAESQGPEAPRPSEPSPPSQQQDEEAWRTRISEAREQLRRNEMFAEALQTRINSLSRDFVNRDNPVQRAGIAKDRAEALNELARVKQEIELGKKQIADIEEEARKAGVPPGWLR